MNLIACLFLIVYAPTAKLGVEQRPKSHQNFDGTRRVSVSSERHGELLVIDVELLCEVQNGPGSLIAEIDHFFAAGNPDRIKTGFLWRWIVTH